MSVRRPRRYRFVVFAWLLAFPSGVVTGLASYHSRGLPPNYVVVFGASAFIAISFTLSALWRWRRQREYFESRGYEW